MEFIALSQSIKQTLLEIAWHSIKNGYQTGHPYCVNLRHYPVELAIPRATFVTLKKNHILRGSYGSLEAIFPLAEDIAENAFAAAYQDPMLPPLRKNELNNIDIYISILSTPQLIVYQTQQELLDQIQPFKDGIILEHKDERATLLPMFWINFPNKHQFIRQLKHKSGLSPDNFSKQLTFYRYTTLLFNASFL